MKRNMKTGNFKTIFEKNGSSGKADVTVIISLYNYEKFIINCLQSVYLQTEKNLDIIVVDDCSTDKGLQKVKNWMNANSSRFNRVLLLHHIQNQGLSVTRNTAVGCVETPYVFVLDADNELFPHCVSKLKVALNENKYAFFAYNIICIKSESGNKLMGYQSWDKELLSKGNYIDAMSLIRKKELISKI